MAVAVVGVNSEQVEMISCDTFFRAVQCFGRQDCLQGSRRAPWSCRSKPPSPDLKKAPAKNARGTTMMAQMQAKTEAVVFLLKR